MEAAVRLMGMNLAACERRGAPEVYISYRVGIIVGLHASARR
jgi:hypothetical protein